MDERSPGRQPLVIGLGEVLWDLLPGGKVLGGAPANFAYHAHALGAEAWPVTCIGQDAPGEEILGRFRDLGLTTDGVAVDATAPTGTVLVELLSGGRHRFTIVENVAWDRLIPTDAARAAAGRADVLCFGTLGQRCEVARASIQALTASTPAHCLRIFDINLRQHFYSPEVIETSLDLANALKVNDQELPVLAEILDLRGSPEQQIAELADRFDLSLVALTRGENGSLLHAKGQMSEHPGFKTEVMDTIGAGDAFTAALALGYLAGWSLDDINLRANQIGSYVCSQRGATPPIPPELRSLFATPTP